MQRYRTFLFCAFAYLTAVTLAAILLIFFIYLFDNQNAAGAAESFVSLLLDPFFPRFILAIAIFAAPFALAISVWAWRVKSRSMLPFAVTGGVAAFFPAVLISDTSSRFSIGPYIAVFAAGAIAASFYWVLTFRKLGKTYV